MVLSPAHETETEEQKCRGSRQKEKTGTVKVLKLEFLQKVGCLVERRRARDDTFLRKAKHSWWTRNYTISMKRRSLSRTVLLNKRTESVTESVNNPYHEIVTTLYVSSQGGKELFACILFYLYCARLTISWRGRLSY